MILWPKYITMSTLNLKNLIAVAENHNIPEDYVREWYKAQKHNQILNVPTKKEMIYHKIIAPNGTYMIDLIFFDKDKRENNNYSTLFLAIECTSRKAFLFPIKKKTIGDIIEAFDKLLNVVNVFSIISDNEPAFLSHQFQKVLTEKNIEHFVKHPDDHNSMSILNRFVRTFRDMLDKYFVATNTRRWFDVYEQLLNNYNNRVHTSLLNHTPNEVFEDSVLAEEVRNMEHIEDIPAQNLKHTFNVGDKVRYLKEKDIFDKGKNKWSDDVYVIDKIEGNSFHLKTLNGTPVKYTFRYHHLQHVDDVQENPNKNKNFNLKQHKQQAKNDRLNKRSAIELNTQLKDYEIVPVETPSHSKRQIKQVTRFKP